jgi:general secretion pathway protein K
MDLKKSSNQQGMALLMTLTIITILIAAALELNRRVRSAVFATATTRDRVTLGHMTTSGIHAAMALLALDKKDSETDSVQETWADEEKVSQLTADIPFEDGTITIVIFDELARIQVNAMLKFPSRQIPDDKQLFLWDRFLTLFIAEQEAYEEIEPRTIIDSLKDWQDAGDDDAVTGLSGAESDYYESLDPPYPCRNGPIAHIRELLLVKGITFQLFNGVADNFGINRFITVYGLAGGEKNASSQMGKININTAEIPVLAALLPPGSDNVELAKAMSEYRLEMSDAKFMHDLSSPLWYKQVSGLSDIDIDPALITTVSDVFRIRATAELQKMQKTVTAVVLREKDPESGKWGCRIISFEN